MPGAARTTITVPAARVGRAGGARRREARSAGCEGCGISHLGLQRLLERRGGLEARRLGGGDLDRLAGLRVAALAGGALGHAELAEAGQADLIAPGQLAGDLVEGGLDGLLGLTIAQAGLLGDGLGEGVLIDGAHVFFLLLDGDRSARRYAPTRTESASGRGFSPSEGSERPSAAADEALAAAHAIALRDD